MEPPAAGTETPTLRVENIGGITETEVELSSGVTVLTGRNATNRTSLLQAVMAAVGSDEATLKGDADEGRVELTIDGQTCTRRLTRTNGSTVVDGDPYLEDATLADLFAFLLETNDARQAVARGEDLRDVLMRPVDTDEIERQIDRLRSRRDDIDAQIEDIDQLERKLPDLEEKKTGIAEQIADKRNELSDIESQIAEIDESVDEKQEQKEKIEENLDDLDDVRGELETVRHQLDTERDSLEALRDERESLEAEREDYDELPEGRLDGIEAEIGRLRDRKDDLNERINELQTVVEFNEGVLEGDHDVFDELRDDEGGSVTDQLVEDSVDVVCWTCGSHTETTQVESMLADLRELRDRYMDERGDVVGEIDDLTDQRRQLREKRRQRAGIEDRLEAVTDEIDRREARVEELRDRRADLTDEVETLEAAVERLRADDDQESELLDLHKEANRLEVEIDRLEDNLASVESEIERIEDRADERDELADRRDGVRDEIEDLRTRVDRLEEEAVRQFNDHMASVLEILDYDNLERVWIERTEERVREGRRTVTESRFDLTVVRSTDAGSVYEDTVDHLSESEREVTGLVFALAGYLVHDVHDEVPFMLIDSVEAIDAPRLADLVDYFRDYADYVVTALLEQDAQALDDEYRRITEV